LDLFHVSCCIEADGECSAKAERFVCCDCGDEMKSSCLNTSYRRTVGSGCEYIQSMMNSPRRFGYDARSRLSLGLTRDARTILGVKGNIVLALVFSFVFSFLHVVESTAEMSYSCFVASLQAFLPISVIINMKSSLILRTCARYSFGESKDSASEFKTLLSAVDFARLQIHRFVYYE
jgi:hypothetical protein